jgi:phosphatidylglycerophosphate synthase
MSGERVHNYKPPKPTYFTRYVAFPFYDFIVTFYPHCWTPNGITLFGIFCTTVASILLFQSMPVNTNFTIIPEGTSRLAHLLTPLLNPSSVAGRGTTVTYPLSPQSMRPLWFLPDWWTTEVTLVIAGILNLVYCIADNTDGRQARRTKRSTFIGEYLDHGLDCVTSLMSAMLLATALGASVPLACVGVLAVSCATSLCHTVNHETGIMIWGNDYLSVDEAMIAFGVGLWVPVLYPGVYTVQVPEFLLCGVLPAGLKIVDVAYVLYILAQFQVCYTLYSVKRSILSRPATLFIALNALFFVFMMPHPYYTSGALTSAKAYSGVCGSIVAWIESNFSYPAILSITVAATSSMICHMPIVAKCAGLSVAGTAPLGGVVLVWLLFAVNPVWGVAAAVSLHIFQVLYNIQLVQRTKEAAAANKK